MPTFVNKKKYRYKLHIILLFSIDIREEENKLKEMDMPSSTIDFSRMSTSKLGVRLVIKRELFMPSIIKASQ